VDGGTISLVILAVALGGPVLLGLAGLVLTQRARTNDPATGWDWWLAVHSTLLYTIAFNLVFFIQELFLVLPKAFTPGLKPTLYHNNHNWTGDHPLENLFQGTGVAAILLTGLACAWLMRRHVGATPTWRVFWIWMAYNGLFMGLPQLATNLLSPGSDVSRAMTYLDMGFAARTITAFAALAAMVIAGLWFTRPFLELAERDGQVATAGRRSGFIFNVVTLPALIAILLIVPFRVPRETLEVLLPPIAVAFAGVGWIQASAWQVTDARAALPPGRRALVGPFLVALALLAIFQIVLRPGVDFF
jgi:hypothetical protein